MVQIQLTSGQAVTLHGWMKPRDTLTWQDIMDNENLTFDLCRKCSIQPKQLHKLQPDILSWIQDGGVTLKNVPEMKDIWTINLVKDFKADLADILNLKSSCEELQKMQVTYDCLLALGMTPATMQLFGFTLMNWHMLGLTREHLRYMTDAHIVTLFATSRQNCESSLSMSCATPEKVH